MLDLSTANAWSATIAIFTMVLPICKGEEREGELWKNECKIAELSQRLTLCKYRLELCGSRNAGDLERLKELMGENETRLRALRLEKSSLSSEITTLEIRNNESFRVALQQQRDRSQGTAFATLSTRDGRTFKNVIVSVVDDVGVAIRHEHGAARLRYAELSDEQRVFFGLEESSALAAEHRERSEALAYEQSIDLELEAMREREERTALSEEENNRSRALASTVSSGSLLQKETRALAQPAKAFGSGYSYRRWYGYSGYRTYQPVYRYVQPYPSAPNPFCSSARPRVQTSVYPTRTCTPIPTAP